MSTKRAKFRPAWIALALSILIGAPPLMAWEDSAVRPSPAGLELHVGTVSGDTLRPIELAPVEITVLRTPVRQDAASLAVGVLSQRELRRGRSGAFLEEALQGLPGVQVQNRHNFAVGERISVRGFGGRAQFGVRGIRVVVDGIPATLADGQSTIDHLDIGSLGRVEVVRGPASALFGNASGGVIAFQSREPGPSPFGVEVESVGGSHGLLRTQATATGTVDATGYLFSVSTQSWDGYRTNTWEALDRSTYGAADRLGLNARVIRPVRRGELALTLNAVDLDSENPGSLARERLGDTDRPAHDQGAFSNVARRTGKDLQQQQMGLRWDGPAGGLDLDLSVFGIRRSMVNPIPSDIIELDRDAVGVRTQVGRTESTGMGDLRWHLGVETDFMFDDRLNFANDAGEPGEMRVNQRERVRAVGVFLQANLPLPGRVEGLAGVRYDRHDFRIWDQITDRPEGEPSAGGERDMDAISPSFGVQFPMGRIFNVFGNVGTVFETPSTTELGNDPEGQPGFNPELEPQTGVSGELGIRGNWMDRAIFEVTTYWTELENELVRFQVEAFPDRDFFRNAGESRHTGVEATFAALTQDGLLRGDLTYTWTNARFRDFEWDEEQFGENRIPGIAPHRAQAKLRVAPGVWFGEITGSYIHRVPVNDQNSAYAPSHFLMDLRLAAEPLPVANVTVSPWVAMTNLLDRYYTASVVPNAFGARYYEPGPGRSFQVGLRAGWGN